MKNFGVKFYPTKTDKNIVSTVLVNAESEETMIQAIKDYYYGRIPEMAKNKNLLKCTKGKDGMFHLVFTPPQPESSRWDVFFMATEIDAITPNKVTVLSYKE